jgi:two-component system, OmpR family, sensor kinase
MSRIPIKLKLSLAFALVLAIVLGATGLFLYVRLSSDLDASIDQGLRSRADQISSFIKRSNSPLGQGGTKLSEREERFAQVLDDRGRLIDSSSQIADAPVLTPQQRERAAKGTILLNLPSLPGDEEQARVLATPVPGERKEADRVVIVATTLESRDDALHSLGKMLLIGGPIALLLASLAGYGVATASLRPVERMRRRAAAISSAVQGQRLPVPPARDEIGRLGETLNAMLSRLETSFERERSFVADASHELRTPLAVLKTELELALGRGRSAEELEDALKSAVEETDRLVQLAEDLLVIARSDQGKLPVRLTSVRVDDVLTDVQERFSVRSRETMRPLVADGPTDLSLTADPLRLRQALGNLVDNALRYGDGTVKLSARASNGNVELHVSDDGPGFPPTFIDQAFERFSRAESARSRGGTGLGLAIVEAIAKAHSGGVVAENLPDGGADVWLSLPRKPR